MATELLLIREGDKLGAAEPYSLEAIQAMKHGEVVTATVRRTRNPRHHRMFFALLNIVFQNQSAYVTLEQLLNAVKIKTGYYNTQTINLGGFPVQVCIPLSISFAKMDQSAFNHFFEKAIAFILSEVLPGMDKADLERQVYELLGAG